ncbi:MAG TPA: OmpA family protein [Patescibacteria group bacterium]|nr:OmpA family protein [Patescibacteria group bacterium]
MLKLSKAAMKAAVVAGILIALTVLVGGKAWGQETKVIRIQQVIYFSVGSAKLSPEAENTLREVATIIQENPELKVLDRGQASRDGGELKNLHLSTDRADAAADFLVSLGIPRYRLDSFGTGASKSGEGEEFRVVRFYVDGGWFVTNPPPDCGTEEADGGKFCTEKDGILTVKIKDFKCPDCNPTLTCPDVIINNPPAPAADDRKPMTDPIPTKKHPKLLKRLLLGGGGFVVGFTGTLVGAQGYNLGIQDDHLTHGQLDRVHPGPKQFGIAVLGGLGGAGLAISGTF